MVPAGPVGRSVPGFPAPPTVTSCELSRGGSIYTTESGKCYASGVFSFGEQLYQHTAGLRSRWFSGGEGGRGEGGAVDIGKEEHRCP